jgi:hypothetical protein
MLPERSNTISMSGVTRPLPTVCTSHTSLLPPPLGPLTVLGVLLGLLGALGTLPGTGALLPGLLVPASNAGVLPSAVPEELLVPSSTAPHATVPRLTASQR